MGFHQAAYVNYLLERFDLVNAKPRSTPLPAGTRLGKPDWNQGRPLSVSDHKLYHEMLGCIIYLATWSWPTLSYAASTLGSVASSPTHAHLKLLRGVLCYCKHNPFLGVRYGPPQSISHLSNEERVLRGLKDRTTSHDINQLVVHVDSSFAQESAYHSQSGVMIFFNGGLIHWSSTRQELPALSSTEAEIIGGSHGLRPTLHLYELLQDLDIEVLKQKSVPFGFDNQNAIRFNESARTTFRNMHIGSRHSRLRHHHKREITMFWLNTRYMTADIHTKALSEESFVPLQNRIVYDFCNLPFN